jgi:hypothetical protein
MARNRADNARLTAGTLLGGAIELSELADLHAASRSQIDLNVRLLTFLLGRSLELALKAVLRHDGASETRLRGYSHHVGRGYDAVLAAHSPAGLRKTQSRGAVLRLLQACYPNKLLEYPQVGAYRLPPPCVLRGLAHEAILFALDHVRGRGTAARLVARKAPGVVISPSANYGNASRFATMRDQIRQAERILAQQ